MKVDILAISAHPDDVELSCGGTILKHVLMGKRVAIVDLTRGELGTRGTAETRKEEAQNAADILGLVARENLAMKDGFFNDSEEHKRKLITAIRKYQPEIILANSITDRHPDHGKASKLVSECCFLAGLSKIETVDNGENQIAWRPQAIYHYIQDRYINPDFIVDVTDFIDKKIEVVKAYKTQFYDPNSKEPETPISGEGFFDFLKSRAREFGRLIKTDFGEGFTVEVPLKVEDITKTI